MDLESRGIDPCSENKGADQLRGYCKADLRLCFRLCKLLVFPCCSSINRKYYYMSKVMRKPDFCLCKNEDLYQMIRTFVFVKQKVQSFLCLNLKFQTSRLVLDLVRKPQNTAFLIARLIYMSYKRICRTTHYNRDTD